MNNRIKVLYVDDEEINLELFQISFEIDFEILTGNDGFKGLEILENTPDIQVIISDMKMPRMNGIEFIKKAQEKYPDKRYYILTGFEITNEIQEALDTCLIHKYFRKPFNYQEIKNSINHS